ncbi:MAG: hypothetical protein D6729_17670 [Deltaproteobacteria bacterium]|nr:MAG: hypothetical protein D6729_17670 [Deltaproteobacteria bacterium]
MNPRLPYPALPALCLLALLAAACGAAEAPCRASDECPSNEACIAGRCQASDDADGGAHGDGGSADAGSVTNGGKPDGGAGDGGGPDGGGSDGGSPDAGGHDGGAPEGCVPIDDGVLSAEEAPLSFSAGISYLEAGGDEPLPVDLVGREVDGVRTWDFTGPYPGEWPVSYQASPLEGHWFADRFTGPFTGTVFVLPLSTQPTLYGVYERTQSALLLHGVASEESGRTALAYEPAVEVVRYPLRVGDTWTERTRVSGLLDRLFFQSEDTYHFSVDDEGVVLTPAGRFPSLRVRLVLELRVPIAVYPFWLDYRYVRHTFLTPCLGVSAYVASREDEAKDLFTEAERIRRLGR